MHHLVQDGRDSSSGSDSGSLEPRDALTALGEVVYDWDLTSDSLTFGPNLSDLFGRPASTLPTGRSFAICIEPGSGRSPHDAIAELGDHDKAEGVVYRTRYLLRTAPDHLLAVEDTGRCFPGADGRPCRARGVLHVRRLSHADDYVAPETIMSQRAGLVRRIDDAIKAARGTGRAVAVVVASISSLAQINDDLGEEPADEVIRVVGGRFAAALRSSEKLVRYAGNRYGTVLGSCTAEQARVACERFRSMIEREAVDTPAGPLAVSVAMGAAAYPVHAADGAALLRCAEDALRIAKRAAAGTGQDSGRIVLFDHAMRQDMRHSHTQQRGDLLMALNERRAVLAFQPIVDSRTRETAFEEGLLRIVGTDGTIAGASEIIPMAEKLGIVRLIDHRTLELAAESLSSRPAAKVSINVSPLSLTDAEWLDALAAQVGARPGIAERLIIEITETAAIADPEALASRLNLVKALGVMIGIDDFGAGHTSFRHLRHFPIDFIKIDGAFVQNLASSPDDRFFVRTLLDLAQNLGIATVAEWVENEETAALLASWGVDYLQGTHTGRPVMKRPQMHDSGREPRKTA